MSKIPYSFRTPIPTYFYMNGFLDPKKKSFDNRIKFVMWAFSKCYCVDTVRCGVKYDAFEFSLSRERGAEEAGLSEKAFRLQMEYHLENGFLKKSANKIQNRCSRYKWQVHLFVEKLVKIEDARQDQDVHLDDIPLEKEGTTNSICALNEGPTDLRVENINKGPTDLKKGTQKGQPKNQPIYETETSKKGTQKGQPKDHFYRTIAIKEDLSSSDNVAKLQSSEKLSPSSNNKITAFFNPRTYRLKNGEPLSPRTQNAFAKYSFFEKERLLANVQHYEKHVNEGKPITSTHERFLQCCIRDDLARKEEYKQQNDLTVRWMIEEYKLKNIKIFQTVVQIRKNDYEPSESISKELPPKTFSEIFENHLNNYNLKDHYAT